MMKSPGHRDHPEHKVQEHPAGRRMRVEVGGEVLADSADVLELDEDGHPPRYYFPRTDTAMGHLVRTSTTSKCPFKGLAHYYDVRAGSRVLRDAVWAYEEPYEEHVALRDRVAFYSDRYPEITIRAA